MTRSLTRVSLGSMTLLCASILWLSAPTFAAAVETLSPAQVVAMDRGLDGTEVWIEGEAIGEALHAGDGRVWVNVLGDGVAVGALMSREMADEVQVWGDHRHDGDTVRLSGTVNVACDEHDGEFDVHVESFEVLERGFEREAPISPWKGIVGAAGIALFLIELRLFRQLKERRLV